MQYGWEVLRILLVLALIVGLIVVVLRFVGKRNRGWWLNRSLRSLGGISVGTNKSLQIVEWNGRIYVLGVGDNVTLLESITDPDAAAALLAEHDAANAEPQVKLSEWMRRLTNRGRSDETQTSDPTRPSFEQTLETRLRELSERRQRVEDLLDRNRSGDRTDEP